MEEEPACVLSCGHHSILQTIDEDKPSLIPPDPSRKRSFGVVGIEAVPMSSIRQWSLSRMFLRLVRLEMSHTDAVFQAQEEILRKMAATLESSTDNNGDNDASNERHDLSIKAIALVGNLRTYAVLNYLAILKICKKFDKHVFCEMRVTRCIVQDLQSCIFFVCLRDASKFCDVVEIARQYHGEGVLDNMGQCPVCLHESTTLHMLPCRHQFCWSCLQKSAAAGLVACALCRSEQSLEPVDLTVLSILQSQQLHKFGSKTGSTNKYCLHSLSGIVQKNASTDQIESPKPKTSVPFDTKSFAMPKSIVDDTEIGCEKLKFHPRALKIRAGCDAPPRSHLPKPLSGYTGVASVPFLAI